MNILKEQKLDEITAKEAVLCGIQKSSENLISSASFAVYSLISRLIVYLPKWDKRRNKVKLLFTSIPIVLTSFSYAYS